MPDARAWPFLAQATFWILALFAAFRLAWVDQHLIGALVGFQKALVSWYGPAAHPGIIVNSSCSGADVMALCAAVTLSYPLAWSRRLLGAALGIAGILILNIARIASLHAVASTPETLNLLHVYVWPIVLSVAALSYVLLWIRGGWRGAAGRGAWRRFAWWSLGTMLVYAAAVPWVFTSPWVEQVGAWTAAAGGGVLAALGATAHASGTVLTTARGAFQVTQQCLFSPVLPLGVAAACAFPMPSWQRAAWLLAAAPLLFLLGVARLLVLALPPLVAESPLTLAHGFYQLLAGGVVIVVGAHIAEGAQTAASSPCTTSRMCRKRWPPRRRAAARAAAALGVALIAGMLATTWWPLLARLVDAVHTALPAAIPALEAPDDPQGALALLPAFQVGLVAGLWVALHGLRKRRTLVALVGGVALSQVVFLSGFALWTSVWGAEPHALVIRGWALIVPLAIVAAFTRAGAAAAGATITGEATAAAGTAGGSTAEATTEGGTTRRAPATGATTAGDHAYRRFWHGVGEAFPSLTGAASTAYYLDTERRLIGEALPSLGGRTILKTDLWDEAKNTRILQWMAAQGARVHAVDLSEPIVRQARAAFDGQVLRPALSDVRRLPFADRTFDAIYSMGTIEHFAETEATVAELARVLKPGGRLILGVPNRHDPFLRPLMVAVLYRLGLYAYGYEKSYSRRALRAMIEDTGLDVHLESGLLFMPGWLRMLDLWCHTRAPALAVVPRMLLRPFVWLDKRLPAVRRHGYLLASVAVKPQATERQDHSIAGGTPQNTTERAVGRSTVAHPGVEYIVDAHGCSVEALRSVPHLQQLFAEVIADLELHPVAPPVWHVFPGGGVTGMVLLSESHLSVHTYPEAEFAAVNLYCCRAAAEWPWDERLRRLLGAHDVAVRVVERGEGSRQSGSATRRSEQCSRGKGVNR